MSIRFRPNFSMMEENNIVPNIPPRHGRETTKAPCDCVSGPDFNGVSSDVRTKKFGPAHEQLDPNDMDNMLPCNLRK